MLRRRVAWSGVVFAALVLVVALAVVWGAASAVPLFFLARAFPQLLFLGTTAVAVFALVAAAVLRVRVPVISAVLLALVSAGVGTVQLSDRAPTVAAVMGAPTAGQLRILSWNTNQQDVTAQQLEAIVDVEAANVVVLPEYFTTVARGTLAGLADKHDMRIVGSEDSAATLLVARNLGTYRVVKQSDTPAWAGFVASPDRASSPTLLVAHLQRPSLDDSSVWSSHIAWARHVCSTEANVVAVGDFNTTLSNLGSDRLGRCVDAAAALGDTASGTWPTALPAALGASIDHAFVGPDWRVEAFGVLRGANTAGSDHRPIFTVIDPRR